MLIAVTGGRGRAHGRREPGEHLVQHGRLGLGDRRSQALVVPQRDLA